MKKQEARGVILCVFKILMGKILQRKDWGHKFARDYAIREISILGTRQEAAVVPHLPCQQREGRKLL